MKPIRLRATTHKPAEKRTLTFKQASTLLPIAQPQFANIQCTSCIGFNVKSMNNMFINLTERHALGKLFTTCVSALPIFKYIHNQTLLLLPSSLHAIKAARAVITALGRGIASEFFFNKRNSNYLVLPNAPKVFAPHCKCVLLTTCRCAPSQLPLFCACLCASLCLHLHLCNTCLPPLVTVLISCWRGKIIPPLTAYTPTEKHN